MALPPELEGRDLARRAREATAQLRLLFSHSGQHGGRRPIRRRHERYSGDIFERNPRKRISGFSRLQVCECTKSRNKASDSKNLVTPNSDSNIVLCFFFFFSILLLFSTQRSLYLFVSFLSFLFLLSFSSVNITWSCFKIYCQQV